MPLVAAAVLPHAPVLVPEIGGAQRSAVPATVAALEQVSARIGALHPDAFVFAGPRHLEPVQATNALVAVTELAGDFRQFGSAIELALPVDLELAESVVTAAADAGVPLSATQAAAYRLDWGILVPLYFATLATGAKPALAIILYPWVGLAAHFWLGQAVATAIARDERRIVLVASADLSHALKPGAPSGYHPRGVEFDQQLVDLVRADDAPGLLAFDPALAAVAAQDALPSALWFAGALAGKSGRTEVLSYEGTLGVGYMVAFRELK